MKFKPGQLVRLIGTSGMMDIPEDISPLITVLGYSDQAPPKCEGVKYNFLTYQEDTKICVCSWYCNLKKKNMIESFSEAQLESLCIK